QAGGRQAWQPCPPAPVLTASTPPWVIPATAGNHPRVQLIHAALSKRRRRAWTACGRDLPAALATALVDRRRSGSRKAGRHLAQQAVEAGRSSHTKKLS